MNKPQIVRSIAFLALPLALLALPGCSGQPPATTVENQAAKEKEAQDKMKNALQSDPTLQKPGATTPAGSITPPGGTTPPPGAPP
jgi:hypothetical protein